MTIMERDEKLGNVFLRRGRDGKGARVGEQLGGEFDASSVGCPSCPVC